MNIQIKREFTNLKLYKKYSSFQRFFPSKNLECFDESIQLHCHNIKVECVY